MACPDEFGLITCIKSALLGQDRPEYEKMAVFFENL